MTYDAAAQRVVLFGGRGGAAGTVLLSDTWEWDGVEWRQRTPASTPPARQFSAMAYDSMRRRVVLLEHVAARQIERVKHGAVLRALLRPQHMTADDRIVNDPGETLPGSDHRSPQVVVLTARKLVARQREQ